MKFFALSVLAVICVLATLVSISQIIMAFMFGEIGRVIFYLVLTVVCVELAIILIIRLAMMRKSDRT